MKNRLALTKLGTSNHNLAMETGRWTKTIRENRLCNQCTEHKVEDVKITQMNVYQLSKLLNLKQTLIYHLKQIEYKTLKYF